MRETLADFFPTASTRLELWRGVLLNEDVFNKKPKPRERFYLLPGQGGRNYRQKQKKILAWTVAAAVVFGTVLAFFIVWFGRPLH
jgi:hypothetical protein